MLLLGELAFSDKFLLFVLRNHEYGILAIGGGRTQTLRRPDTLKIYIV